MPHYLQRRLHERDAYLPASGSVVVSNPTPTASLLAQNTAAIPNSSANPVGIPLVSNTFFPGASTSATRSSSPTATASTSPSPGNQISLASVIGACVAAVVVLLLSVALALYCSRRQKKPPAYSRSRNAANNGSRERLHLEAWTRMEDKEVRWEDKERREQQGEPMKQRPPSEPLGAMFQRTISNVSGEKSSEGHNRESIGTMQHFAKYHPGLAAEMAAQNADSGADGRIARPPPVLHLMGRGVDMPTPTSWDGETFGGDSSHTSLSSPMSPYMMATARATPPATSSSPHHWETAEVVHVAPDGDEDMELRNPFSDNASTKSRRSSSSRGRNPFFSAQDHPIKRPPLPGTPRNPFEDTDSTRDSAAALRSLIAALEGPERLSSRIPSMQSSVYSRGTTMDDGESTISVTAFPYPPAKVNLR